MKKTFEEWLKESNYQKEIRNYNSDKECLLLDLKGFVINKFDNLQQLSRHLKYGQLSKLQYDSLIGKRGCIIDKKYRVFTIKFFHENYTEIQKLISFSCHVKEKKRIYDLSQKLICDLYPNKDFKNIKQLSETIKKHQETIRDILKGKIKKNEYNIRYKHPELNKK